MNSRSRFLPMLLAWLLAATVCLPAAVAQTKPAAKSGDDSAKLIERLRKRIAELEQQNAALKKQRVSGAPRLIAFLESSYYGARYYSSTQPKFFAARLLFVNLSRKPVKIKRDGMQLVANGKTHKIVDVPAAMRYSYFYIGTQRYTLGELKMEKELALKPGGTASTWAVFLNVAKKNDVPKMTLQLKFDTQTITIDVNEFAKQQMGMKVERIGPRGGLGLVTISGSMNSVNVGSLVDAINELTKQKVVRVVIRWTKTAAKIDGNMQNWIVNEANTSGRSMNRYNNYPFPDIPATVRELHLAQMPNGGSSPRSMTYYGPYGPVTSASRVHKSDVEAVSAALRSAYQVLPADELVKEIEHGHPLTRAAALAGGGGRLPADKLPVVLRFADDKDPKLQRAALAALSQFGEPAAIDKLADYVHHKTAVLSKQAIVSLASSRFASAHRKLLAMLKTEPTASKKKIVKVIAAHPRPIWSETIYEFAKDPNSSVGADALKALGTIGHPKLVDVLEASVKSSDKAIRDQALMQLSVRGDSRSEKIALDYTLAAIKTSPPTPQMYNLLRRTKDARAIPLLLKHLDESQSSNSTLIDTLATIGDQTVGEKLADRYAKTKSDYQKSYILRALVKLKSPRFRKLAGEAMMSRDGSLISAACDGLREDAGPEAVRLMVAALDKSTYSTAWSYAANSLSQIGTPEARAALVRARESKNASKRSYAISALRNLTQRSPGYQYIYRATESMRQKKVKEALQFYNLALKLDDELSVAYSGRGLAYLKQKKFAEATKDFAKAEKLDPYDIDAVTGSALLLARGGKHAEAVKKVEGIRKQFASDRHYLYSAARVYSSALAALGKTKASPARKAKTAEYQKQAMKDLTTVFKNYRGYYGFPKEEDVKNEPDFGPLRQLPEYRKLFNPTAKAKKAGGKAAVETKG
jgi:HEAT repeat protein